MLRQLLFAALLTSSIGTFSYAQAPSTAAVATGPDSIRVTVNGVRSTKGRVRVELWSSEVGFPRQNEHATKTVWIDATQAAQGTVTTTFDGLQPGSYAIAAMHDENSNGKLDASVFGVPKEGWAVSNNVTSHTHPPKFQDAKIQVNAPDQATTLNLHY